MTRRTTPLAYVLRPWLPPHDLRTTAVLTCAKCPREGKLLIPGGNNPEKIEKLFIRMGWDCNVHNASECICPTCVKQREIRAGEAAKARREQPPGLIAAQQRQALSPPKEVAVRSSSPRGDIGIKELTAEQKTALRNELGGTFDEVNGRYLDGNSDHAISEKLHIPRAVVAEFRENFYGELKDDPEVTAFRAQLEDAKRVLSNMQGTVAKMEAKLEEIAKRVGV